MNIKVEVEEINALLGVVPQKSNLDPELTVCKNLRVYSRYFEIPSIAAEKTASEL
ncbi:MAG: hypothetical protein V1850_01680 [Candidatus Bathyarchaeota archaeon]